MKIQEMRLLSFLQLHLSGHPRIHLIHPLVNPAQRDMIHTRRLPNHIHPIHLLNGRLLQNKVVRFA